jgi:hypothetical protein
MRTDLYSDDTQPVRGWRWVFRQDERDHGSRD